MSIYAAAPESPVPRFWIDLWLEIDSGPNSIIFVRFSSAVARICMSRQVYERLTIWIF